MQPKVGGKKMMWFGYAGAVIPLWIGTAAVVVGAVALVFLATAFRDLSRDGVDVRVTVTVGFEK
jgi:hypothetical protein